MEKCHISELKQTEDHRFLSAADSVLASPHLPAGLLTGQKQKCGEKIFRYLEFLNLSSQRGVSADVLEERRLEADPQVGLLPVAVFLMETKRNSENMSPCRMKADG